MLEFDPQYYEELTVAQVKTVKFVSVAFFFGWQVRVFILKLTSVFQVVEEETAHCLPICHCFSRMQKIDLSWNVQAPQTES